jgi:predicted transcriptional regulator
MAVDISLVTQLIAKPVVFDVLKEVLKSRIGGGWAVAKKLDKDPEQVEQALGELKSLGLLDAETSPSDHPLDGVYYPTKLGLALEEDLKAK